MISTQALQRINTDMFFCSNRDHEHFNIYSIPLPGADSLHDFFKGEDVVEPDLNVILSSDFNDKCPYLYQDIMVFTSDREGGQGGFDLYYSLYENGAWTTPINLGPEINTEYDEYRPIIFSFFRIPESYNFLIRQTRRTGRF